MHGLDRDELIEAFVFTPGEEPAARVVIGRPGIRVLDRDGEELEEAARSTGPAEATSAGTT
jgi:hypothetical protein